MSLSSITYIESTSVHHHSDVRPGFFEQGFEAAQMDAPSQFPSGSARCEETSWGTLYDFGHCGSREYAGRSFCPPAGASIEVNEAVVSVAAPAASGQRVGIPVNAAQHTPGPVVCVTVRVSDQLARQLIGLDPAYADAMGNERDARIIRERAQRMWDALIAIAKANGGAS